MDILLHSNIITNKQKIVKPKYFWIISESTTLNIATDTEIDTDTNS